MHFRAHHVDRLYTTLPGQPNPGGYGTGSLLPLISSTIRNVVCLEEWMDVAVCVGGWEEGGGEKNWPSACSH